MVVFGRKISLKKLPLKTFELLKMIKNTFQFKDPLRLLRSYLFMIPPPRNKFSLKSGETVYLSSNSHDSLTVMVIFCRNEYGTIPKDSIVLDIGSNIGTYALYAGLNGARKVYAFEPNPEAFSTLVKNIEKNDLSDIIIPLNLGVSDEDDKRIYIPSQSSPYNKSIERKSKGSIKVNTISLPSILHNIITDEVDICKMDCEGAEYEILDNMEQDDFSKIKELRLENHNGSRKDTLIKQMRRYSLRKIHEQNNILWFAKM